MKMTELMQIPECVAYDDDMRRRSADRSERAVDQAEERIRRHACSHTKHRRQANRHLISSGVEAPYGGAHERIQGHRARWCTRQSAVKVGVNARRNEFRHLHAGNDHDSIAQSFTISSCTMNNPETMKYI